MQAIPPALAGWPLELEEDGQRLTYSFDANAEDTGIPKLLKLLGETGIDFKDLDTSRTSLEDIFVSLVENPA
jgi:ABC-2 type transport system ATP-binding protein